VKTIGIFLSLLLALAALQGCSKGSSSNASTSTIRLVNASTNYASLDMISSTTTFASAVAANSGSSYASTGSGTYPITLASAGSGIAAWQNTYSLAAGNYTLLAYTSAQHLQGALLTDNEVAPASGYGKIRVINLSPDAGSVDVYLMATGGNKSATSPLVTYLTGLTSYFSSAKGTYEIWVTGAGNAADLRLDIPSVTIADQQIVTLALTSTTGGYLVNGILLSQQVTAVQAQPNASARVRVVANVMAGGASATVTATANSVSVASSLPSPNPSPYVLVPAGALSLNVQVNSTTVTAPAMTAAAGADLTLLVTGNGGANPYSVSPPLIDDNTLPISNNFKIRLVNGVTGLAGNIGLMGNYTPYALNVAFGTASTPVSQVSGLISPLVVTSATGATLYSPTGGATLQSQGVYSLFMLGNSSALSAVPSSAVGVLIKDR